MNKISVEFWSDKDGEPYKLISMIIVSKDEEQKG